LILVDAEQCLDPLKCDTQAKESLKGIKMAQEALPLQGCLDGKIPGSTRLKVFQEV
jgi:hypothetical protein